MSQNKYTVSECLTDAQIKSIRNAVSDLFPQCQSFLANLVKIDTTNPPGSNYVECAHFIGDTLKSLDYAVEYIEVPDALLPELAPHAQGHPRVNVMGRMPGTEGTQGKTLHANGHFDVVPVGTYANWKHPPFGAEIHDGKMYGRGTADQKAGIAAQIFAVEAIKKAKLRLRGNMEHSAVVDEETTGLRNAGMGYLVEQGYITADRVDAVVITEPLNFDNVCIGHRGTIWGNVAFHGVQSHGSMPGRGVNALHHACSFVHHATETLGPELAKRSDPTVIPVEAQVASLAFTVLHAGANINTVPDHAVVSFDRRLVPPETLSSARQEIHDTLETLSTKDSSVKYEYNEVYSTEGTSVDPEQPISLVFRDAIRLVIGNKAGVVTSPGSDDQRFLCHALRPPILSTIIYGPGHISQAHVTDEYIDLNDLKIGMEVMALAFATFLGVEDAL